MKVSTRYLTEADFPLLFKARYQVYVEEKQWVTGDPETRTEYDRYDDIAHHAGVFVDGDLAGFVRMLGPTRPWLMENELHDVAPVAPEDLKKECGFEVSRIGVLPDYRTQSLWPDVKTMLYRAVYLWSKENGLHIWNITADPLYYRHLSRRFPFQEYEDARTHYAVAAWMTNDDFEQIAFADMPEFGEYMQHTPAPRNLRLTQQIPSPDKLGL